jgi:dienelactone hydrolase
MSSHSKACCTIPPIVAKGYKAKGEYKELNGLKAYFTGPEDATKGLIFIYDIFGYFDQSIQGADILAFSGHEGNNYKVFIPDWFEGKPANIAWYPPKTDEDKANMGNFFQTQAKPERVVPHIPAMVEAAKKLYPNITAWAIIGYCWGGKMVTKAIGIDGQPFKAAAQVHPAMIDSADGPAVKIPQLTLASGDENWEEVQKLSASSPKGSKCKHYPDSIHGWMAARSDLSDPAQEKTYIQGYSDVLEFFAEHV